MSPSYIEHHSHTKLILLLALVGALNIMILDFFFLEAPKTIMDKNLNESAKTVEYVQKEEASCPTTCLAAINQATSSSISNATSGQTTTSITSSLVKEYYISFGSGSNETDDWADIDGLAAYVDSSSYGNIKNVVFEATMHIPTGNEKAFVRLFNASDKHPVWFSEVSLEGGGVKLLISDPIKLDSGNKLYQVQMKTSLKFKAVLDQARLHIKMN